MAEPEDKTRHSQRRRRNFIAKILKDGDLKGAFAIKIIEPKKYKREKMSPRNVEKYIEDDGE